MSRSKSRYIVEQPCRSLHELFFRRCMAHSKTSLAQVLSQIAVGTGFATVFWFSRERNKYHSDDSANSIDIIKSLDQAVKADTSGEVWKSSFVSTHIAQQPHDDESTT